MVGTMVVIVWEVEFAFLGIVWSRMDRMVRLYLCAFSQLTTTQLHSKYATMVNDKQRELNIRGIM